MPIKGSTSNPDWNISSTKDAIAKSIISISLIYIFPVFDWVAKPDLKMQLSVAELLNSWIAEWWSMVWPSVGSSPSTNVIWWDGVWMACHFPAGLCGGVGVFICALNAMKQSENNFFLLWFTVLLSLARPLMLSLKPGGGANPTRSVKTKKNSCICLMIGIRSKV